MSLLCSENSPVGKGFPAHHTRSVELNQTMRLISYSGYILPQFPPIPAVQNAER